MSLLAEPLTYNERLLAELIFRRTAVTRPEISERTGFTGATVTRLVTGMLAKGLVAEEAERNGAMGQPLHKLSLVPRRAYSIGINFVRRRFDVALVDLCGDVISLEHQEIDDVTPDSIASVASFSVENILANNAVARSQIIGVGVSVPGNFAPDGISLRAHDYFSELDGVNLKPILEKALELRCSIEIDGACAALGEFLHGEGRSCRNLFVIHIGHGLGGGTIIDGNLYRGPHGNASKAGALFAYDQPRPSGQDLIEFLQSNKVNIKDIVDLEDIVHAHAEILNQWMDRAAMQLAEVARMATAFLDPDIICIGGRLPRSINDALAKRVCLIKLPGPSRGLPNAKVVSSSLGPNTGALGAASVPVFEQLFPGSVSSRGNRYMDGRRSSTVPKVK